MIEWWRLKTENLRRWETSGAGEQERVVCFFHWNGTRTPTVCWKCSTKNEMKMPIGAKCNPLFDFLGIWPIKWNHGITRLSRERIYKIFGFRFKVEKVFFMVEILPLFILLVFLQFPFWLNFGVQRPFGLNLLLLLLFNGREIRFIIYWHVSIPCNC